jgi:hypothetical protein
MFHLEGRGLIVDQLYIGCSGGEKATGCKWNGIGTLRKSKASPMNTDNGNAIGTLAARARGASLAKWKAAVSGWR